MVPSKEVFSSLPVPEQIVRLEQVDAKTRRELLLSARDRLALTRALSVETLFYTLKEIGLADSTELLALAAPEQVRDMLDLDCWRRDRFDDQRLLTWLLFLDEAGSGKLAEWFLHADVELLLLLVQRHFEVVRKFDVEEDPDFNQARYFTFDDQYLLRFIGEEEPILALLLERLRVLDYRTYQTILEASLYELDSGLEEEALRWRNARLADRGYPSSAEAGALFRFVAPETVSLAPYRRTALRPLRFATAEEVIPSDHALMLLDIRDSFLARVLATLPPEDVEPISHELAILTNQAMIAEARDPGELAEVRSCAELVHDYLNIGVAYLAGEQEQKAAQLLHETMLQPFFRVGLSLTLSLQQRAHQLDVFLQQHDRQGWEEYLDSPFRETFVAVCRHPPLFFQGLDIPGEILYRRFRDVADIKRVETVLRQIPLWFAVLQRWALLPEGRASEGVTLEVLWNTAFACWVVEGKVTAQPLSHADLNTLQKRLQKTSVEDRSAQFLALAVTQLELTDEEVQALRALAALAREKLDEALSIVAAGAAVRFISGLLISR